MLSLSKRRIIKSALKFKYSDSPRITWWLADESLIPVVQSIVGVVRDITNNAVPTNIKVLKLNKRKAVFSMEHPQDCGQSFFAKVFFLNRLEHKLKYHKYGLDEAANLLRARDRGINTPRVYGYGHIYNLLRLVKGSVIILEDLSGLLPIGNLLRQGTNSKRYQTFMRTIPLFVSLYNARCNHTDVNGGAVMLCEHNLNPPLYVLDFQHAKFYNRHSTEILMFEAGNFAKSCRNWISTEAINEWLSALLDSIGVSSAHKRGKMIKQFNYYFRTELSRKQRKKIR